MIKTIQDIAKELDLSTATVSRALNNHTEHLVKSQTKQKILDFVRETGYKPNIKARGLAKGKLTDLFLISSQMVVGSIFYDEYFSNLVRGIHSVTAPTEYSLVILPVENTYTEEDIYNILLNNETAGLILSPYCSHLNFPFDVIKKYSFPVVTLDIEIKSENTYAILLDHKEAGYLGAKSLVEKGYRNLVLVSDIKRSLHSEMRKEGFYDFLNERKPKDVTVKNIEMLLSYTSSQSVLEKILGESKLPVGVFALSDEIAVGIVNYLKYKGLRCPEDVGVIGFDGLSIRKYAIPAVNSIGFSYSKIGEIAAQILIDVLSGKERNKTTFIKAYLTEGESF
ncbi:MAG: LacI family DNA-binding transcriptional regulator [Candidatus Omnitrophica bacterium]|nr:LacI family DNA-binding transcriptional regulator [Candidatus Omnitrophota bacterium]